MKEHLKHFFPFLRTEFRKLEEKELQSEETFKELFPNDAVELWKLRTIYVYQNSNELNTSYVADTNGTIEVEVVVGKNKVKTKGNAKV